MNASAIAHHHQILKRLLAPLLVYAGLTDETETVRSPAGMRQRSSEPFTLARRICDLVQRLLVPLESATRRLIFLAACHLPAEEKHAAAKTALDGPTLDPSLQGSGKPVDASAAVSLPPCGERSGVGSLPR